MSTSNPGKIKFRRGTTSQWADSTNNDLTLAEGQPGIEYRSGKSPRIKVGPQSGDTWGNCKYVGADPEIYSDTAAVNTNNNISLTGSSINTSITPTPPSGISSIGAGAFARNIVISTNAASNAENYLDGTIWIQVSTY